MSLIDFINGSTTKSTNTNYVINWGDSSPDFVSSTFTSSTSHTYAVGLWTLTYTITGNNGCSITRIYKVFVGNNPAVGIGNPGNTNICIGTALVFPITGTVNNPPGTIYKITFNDGSTPEIFNHPPPASVTHTFLKSSCGVTSSTQQNSFSATIEASNPCDVSFGSVVPIRVSSPSVPNFKLPNSIICVNTQTCFTNESIGGGSATASACVAPKVVWQISPAIGFTVNSGSLGSDNNGSININTWTNGSDIICPIFNDPGIYTITMKSGNSCGINEVVKTICVEKKLSPQFTLIPTGSCAPLQVTATNNTNLTNQCSPPAYLWKVSYTSGFCGSGTVNIPNQTTVDANYTFTQPGTYSITLTTANSCGSVTSAPQTVVVKQPPTVTINSIANFCQNLSLNAIANIDSCSPNVSATTYLWTFVGGTPASATTKVPPVVSYAIAGNYSVSLAVTNECGTTTASSNTFLVQPAPIVQNETTSVCGGAAFSITPTNATSGNTIPAGTTYSWSPPIVTGGITGGIAGTNQTVISGSLVNITTTAQTATYSITPKVGNCSGNTFTLIVTVNPSPIITGALKVCVGSTTTLTGTTNPATISPWVSSNIAVAAVNDYGVITGGSAGTSTITYTNLDGCQKTATITVNPLPTVTVNSPAVCSGLSATLIATAGVAGTYSYIWTVPAGFTNPGNVTSFSTTLAGTYSVIIKNTLTGCESSSASGTVTANALPNLIITDPTAVCSPSTIDLKSPSITVGSDSGLTFTYWTNSTATSVLSNANAITSSGTYYLKAENTNGCSLIKPVNVVINKTPVITAISNIVKCSNQPSGAINFSSNVVGTTYSWTNDNISIGLAASGTGNIASFTTVNTGTTPVIATLTVTPTTNSCLGASITFTVTVNPTPVVDQTSDQEVCNGLSTTAILFTGNISGTTYNWTNNKPSIGLAASGTGNISSFIASNVTSVPIIATITVTPSINGCSGASKTFTITVNPSPVVTFSPSLQTICSGDTASSVTLNSTTPGVVFAWTTTQPAGITETIQTSGTTTIPSQTYTNTTNTDIIIVYNATATVAGGTACLGAVYTYRITVKPKPSITTPLAQTICSSTAFSITPVDGTGNIVPAGTVYTWSAAVISPLGAITGAIAQNTPQSSIGQTLVNVTDQTATATYTVTPKSGTCTGAPFQVVSTVNPAPKVVFSGANQTLCSGSDSSIINLSSLTTGNVSFNWIAAIPAGISGATASGTTSVIPVQTLVNSTINPVTVIYTATATITDGIACQGQPFTYSITVNPAIVTSNIKSNFNGFNISAVGANDGFIDVTVTGGSGIYNYLWSGPNGFSSLSQDISNLSAGDYTLTINDGLCELVVLNFMLSTPQSLIIQEDLLEHKDVFCNGYLTGVIKVDITQQSVGPYKYELILQGGGIIQTSTNNALTTYSFSGLKAGIYDVKITDTNGSSKTIPGIVITEPSGIIASISSQTNNLCFGDNIGSATVTASGGSGVLTYSWNTVPIQTTPTATGLKAGTYTVTITDDNSCSTSKQVTISEPTNLVTSITAQTNVLCFGNNSGSATISATGGVGPYLFSWDTSPIINSATATGLIAGIYNVTVTDANNCAKVQQVIITQPLGVLSSTISNSTNVSCFGGSDGIATVLATNGKAPYTYSWNTTPIQTSATAIGLVEGNYIVTITDSNGCATSSSVIITQPPAISTSISAQTNVACSGSNTGSAKIVASGGTTPYSYSWNTLPVQTSVTGVNLAMGTYNVTVTDANNCSIVQQVIITEPNGIVTSVASQINVNCFGNSTGSAAISVSGGTAPLTYLWDTPVLNTTLSATGLVAGTYHLTVTDANGCQKIQELVITQPNDIVITSNLEKNITCYGDSDGEIKISVTGGTPDYTFLWTRDGIPYSNEKDISSLSPGVYEVTVSDSNNCGPKTVLYTITQPPVLNLKLLNQTNILCYGAQTGTIDVEVIGGTPSAAGYSFRWTGPNGFTSSNQNLLGVYAGIYQLLVTDNSGCTDDLTVELTQPTAVIVSVVTTPIVCYGSNDASISLTISGGVAPYSVSWNNLAVGIYQNNLSAGDYLATITDSNNCVQIINVNIPEAPIFKIDPVVTQISCFGANDGSIRLNLVGGKPTVKLVWSDGSLSGTTRNNLKPGTYSVSIIDGTPCQITRTFIIVEPQLLILDANVTNALDCNTANSGAINLLVSGGTAPFSYAWSNGAVTEDLAAIPAGNYLVTVTDARNCSATASYSIVRPSPIVIKVETVTDFNCATKVVKQSFIAKVSGGIPPYQYVWSSGTISGADHEIMNTSQNGLVVLDAIDARGCKSSYTFNVAIPELGTPSFATTSLGFNTYGFYSIEDPIQFTNTATGDFTNIGWDFGDGTFSNDLNPVHIYKKEGAYVVRQTVTYPFGCVYVSTVTLLLEKGYRLIPPTAFTPNGDGVNDYFSPEFLGLNQIRFDVYDTWGSLIYSESGDSIRGWDGKINNKEAENGNYYFKIIGKTFYGKIIKDQGAVVLIK